MASAKNHSRQISLFAAVFILLAGIFIGGYLVLKSGQTSASQLDDILNANSNDLAVCNPDPGNPDSDIDHDGLKDWQEIQIYQSNPCRTDTDGDGYLDGEEVASGYDPTKKAPGDELPGTAPKGPRPLPANLTSALSSALAQQIAAGKIDSFDQSGNILSSSDLEKYPGIQQAVRQIMLAGEQLFAPDPIDDKQIKTTTDNSPAAIQRYALGASTAIPMIENDGEDEADLFLNAMQSGDFSKLNSILELHQTAYQNLKMLVVPTELIPLHKEQLNIISGLIKIYQAIKQTEADPLVANLALQKYQVILSQLTGWLQKLDVFIGSKAETNL